jgi:hypothetical protein
LSIGPWTTSLESAISGSLAMIVMMMMTTTMMTTTTKTRVGVSIVTKVILRTLTTMDREARMALRTTTKMRAKASKKTRNEAEGDAESEDGAHVNSDADQEDENDDDEDQPRAILYYITSSYKHVLLLAGQADLCPERIMTGHRYSEQNCACPKVGLTDCTGLWRASPALKKLRWLKLNFIEDQHEPRSTLEGV